MEEDLSLWYDNAQINWKSKGQKLQRIIYGIEYACIYVIVNDYEMRVYDENGIYIRSIASPDGYRYFRFFSVGEIFFSKTLQNLK